MLTMAVPTGRSQSECLGLLCRSGLLDPDKMKDQRELEVLTDRLRLIMVKPQDVPTLVHMGFAHLGLGGSDVIMESSARVVDIMDTGLSQCRMVLAGPPRAKDMFSHPAPPNVRVATKYPRIAERVLPQRGLRSITVPLHGSVEIAPALGISDVIMDIVQTGSTLRANGLVTLEELFQVSIHLIAHPGALETRWESIRDVTKLLSDGRGSM